MKKILRVSVSDGGALDLATSILTLAYGLSPSATPDSLAQILGLGDSQVHTLETAFSYPNGVALLRDEKGRNSLYLFDSDQEKLSEGGTLRDIDPDTPVAAGAPTAGDDAGKLPAKTGATSVAEPALAPEPQPAASKDFEPAPEGVVEETRFTPHPEPGTINDPAPAAALDTDTALGKGRPTIRDPLGGDVSHLTHETKAAYAGSADLGTGDGAIEAKPVPGLTPGYPVDGKTGEAIDLSAEDREKLKGVKLDDGPFVPGEPAVAGETRNLSTNETLTLGSGEVGSLTQVMDPAVGLTGGTSTDATNAADVVGMTDAEKSAQTDLNIAYEQGKAAKGAGEAIETCPHDPSTAEAGAWIDGYTAMEQGTRDDT